MIKKNNIPYNMLSKDLILSMIIKNSMARGNEINCDSNKRKKKEIRRKIRKIGMFSLKKISKRLYLPLY